MKLYTESQVKILTDALEEYKQFDWSEDPSLPSPAEEALASFRKQPVREARVWEVKASQWDNRNACWRIPESEGPGFPEILDENPPTITVIELPTEEVTEKGRPG